MGRTDGARPWLEIARRGGQEVSVPDGATSAEGRVWGCYLHGLFDNANLRRAWLSSLGWRETSASRAPSTAGYGAAFDRLADAVEEALDMALLDRIVWG
jgi:adenosylcobyric acid synthase